MSNSTLINDFNIGFSQLNESNQNYILAISQALLFSQTVPKEQDNSPKQTA